MPNKYTNESVDAILQNLHQQQAAADVRHSVTDHQVDDIIRSLGLGDGGFSAPLPEMPPVEEPVPEPVRRTSPRQEVQPVRQEPIEEPVPEVRPVRREPVEELPQPEEEADTLGDTTRTGIIKGFLLKMAPDAADTDALNQGKNQFQKFFGNSVAVVPDEKGHLREPGKKKRRGLFGLSSAEDTDEFVPINVSLGGGETPAAHRDAYDLDDEEAQTPPPPKKKGFLSGLFGDSDTEELVIPEGRAEPHTLSMQPVRPEQIAPVETEEQQPAPARSKYTAKERTPRRSLPPLKQELPEGDTMFDLRRAARDYTPAAQDSFDPEPEDEEPTITRPAGPSYRKKRDTVEFIPGQKIKTALNPDPEPLPSSISGPVGEPIDLEPVAQPLPEKPASTGFTMQIDSLGELPSDSTQQFMAAYSAVRPRRKAKPAEPKEPEAPKAAPVQPKAPELPKVEPPPPPKNPGSDPMADTMVVSVDQEMQELVRSITGELRLFGEEVNIDDQPSVELPAQQEMPEDDPTRTRTGLIRLTVEEPEPIERTLTGQIKLTPVEPAEPEAMDRTKTGLVKLAPVEPETPPAPARRERPQPAKQVPADFVENIASAINEEESDAMPPQYYQDAAQRLTGELDTPEEPEEGLAKKTKNLANRLRLTGQPDDEQELDSPEAAAPPFAGTSAPRHEYESAGDAPAVRRDLEQQVFQSTVAALVSGGIAVVLLGLGFANTALAGAIPGPLGDATVFLAVCLVLLIACGALCWRTLLAGGQGMVKAPTADSLSCLPWVGAAIQIIVFLADAKAYDAAKMPLLAGPAALVLCFNMIGKAIDARTLRDGFRLVSSGVEHSVAYRLKDAGMLHTITHGLAEPRPSVLVNRPVQIFKGFLAASRTHRTSDKNQQQFARILLVSALLGLACAWFISKNVGQGVTMMASVLCLGAPLAGTLLSALPQRLMQRSAAQVGAVIPGWKDIRQLGRINVVHITARDLFPAGSLTLCGIKPVHPEHIDLAIVYAASILAEAGPTLRDVFLGMLGDKSMLARVEDRQTVYGKGYIGWVNKRRVLVGNRDLMIDYGVKIPSLEYEQSHTVNQRRVIYLAVSGKLFAMFQVAYQRDNDIAHELDDLRRSGLSLVVDCDDFNCDVQLLETAYSLPSGSVKVLTGAEHEDLDPATAWLPESEGNMLHLGSFASFAGGLQAAAAAAEGERRAAMVLSASVLLSCVLGVVLSISNGMLALPAILLYQAAWAVLALIFPVLQKY